MARRKYQELFSGTGRFTPGTRTNLERAVGRALHGHKGSTMPLRSAVYTATRALRLFGMCSPRYFTTSRNRSNSSAVL